MRNSNRVQAGAISSNVFMLRLFINFMDLLVNKKLEDCIGYRKKLEYMAGFIPQLKNIAVQRETVKGIPLEWITPNHANAEKLIYYLHGGGYLVCSTKTHRRLISKISSEAGVAAVSIDYRLAPEHPFPAALDDSVRGYKIALDKGFDPKDIIIAGDSAGGGLVISTLVKLKQKGLPLPAAAVCISPWTDLEGTGESVLINKQNDVIQADAVKSVAQLYMGKKNLRHPFASPLYADLRGLPPLFIQASASEVLFDDALRLHKKALEQGVSSTFEKWNGMFHGWHAFDFLLPEAGKAIKSIAKFINRYI